MVDLPHIRSVLDVCLPVSRQTPRVQSQDCVPGNGGVRIRATLARGHCYPGNRGLHYWTIPATPVHDQGSQPVLLLCCISGERHSCYWPVHVGGAILDTVQGRV